MNNWRKTASRFHANLYQLMRRYSGETLKTSQIKKIIEDSAGFTKDAQFIYPSDHCTNHTNEGACYCALTENAIFEKIRHGVYRVR